MVRDAQKIEKFRRYAESCARMAQEAHNCERKTLLNEMAGQWIELAEQIANERSLSERSQEGQGP